MLVALGAKQEWHLVVANVKKWTAGSRGLKWQKKCKGILSSM